MNFRSASFFGLVAATWLALVSPSIASIYNVNLSGWGGSVVGTIETDGTIGALQGGNIVDYSLTVSIGSDSSLISGTGPTLSSAFFANATSTSLFFDFGPNSKYLLFGAISGPPFSWVCFSGSAAGCGHGNVQIRVNASAIIDSGSFYQGLTEIGVAAVPEPSTWAMIILGFAGVGAMAYRRSRKDQGAALAAA
jgi:hypothetical protein